MNDTFVALRSDDGYERLFHHGISIQGQRCNELPLNIANDAPEIETAYPIDSLHISLTILTFIRDAIRHHSNLPKKGFVE